jgi:hypothetical protein
MTISLPAAVRAKHAVWRPGSLGTQGTDVGGEIVARIGLFGRRTDDGRDAPAAVGTARVAEPDRDHDGVPDRVEAQEERLVDRDGDTAVYKGHNAETHEEREAREAHERNEARLAARERLAAKERVEERAEAREADTRAVPAAPMVDRDRDGVDDRVETPRMRARASLLATLALMVGLTSVYAALTGRLAPAAVVLGVLGLLLSFGGLTASGKPRVAGGGTAMFALVLSVAGAVLGVLAITGATPWLDSDVDQVAKLRDWLDAQFPFMKGW